MTSPIDPKSCRVAVLVGGKSGEREISLASGKGAVAALAQAGFRPVTIDPSNKENLKRLVEERFDVAFLCLHGKYGEDGTVQGMLDILGIPYTGSGVWSSALAMDKVKSKVFYERSGIPTPPSITLLKDEPYDLDEIVDSLGTHVVVKPATEGSAIGVFIVDGISEIGSAIEKAFEIDTEILVEKYVHGKELTVAVLGNDDPCALPVIEIVPKGDFYDFDSKYAAGGAQHICPADLPEDTAARVRSVAVAAHKALSCRGMSRTDVLLDQNNSCWVLETNTIPGMTETSLLPDAAAAAGISFPDLCVKLLEFALEDQRKR